MLGNLIRNRLNLLIALLAILALGSAIPPTEAMVWPYCGYNEVYKATYYYEYPGGPECGLSYMYCLHADYHEGCTTGYYSEWYYSCECQ